jgi:hypothetical protein
VNKTKLHVFLGRSSIGGSSLRLADGYQTYALDVQSAQLFGCESLQRPLSALKKSSPVLQRPSALHVLHQPNHVLLLKHCPKGLCGACIGGSLSLCVDRPVHPSSRPCRSTFGGLDSSGPSLLRVASFSGADLIAPRTGKHVTWSPVFVHQIITAVAMT